MSQPDVPDVRRRSRNSFLERFHLSFHPLLRSFCHIFNFERFYLSFRLLLQAFCHNVKEASMINTAVSILLVTYSCLSRMPLCKRWKQRSTPASSTSSAAPHHQQYHHTSVYHIISTTRTWVKAILSIFWCSLSPRMLVASWTHLIPFTIFIREALKNCFF